MIYVTFERGGPKFSNITARALAQRTPVQQRQLRAKWLLCSTRFFCFREFIKTETASAVHCAFQLRFNIQSPTRKIQDILFQTLFRIIHIPCTVQEIQTYEIESIFFESLCVTIPRHRPVMLPHVSISKPYAIIIHVHSFVEIISDININSSHQQVR